MMSFEAAGNNSNDDKNADTIAESSVGDKTKCKGPWGTIPLQYRDIMYNLSNDEKC